MFLHLLSLSVWLSSIHSPDGDTVKLKTRSHQHYYVKDTFSGPYFIPNHYKFLKVGGYREDPEDVYYFESGKINVGQKLMGNNVGWLLFVSPYDCDLTFDIIPADTSANFSFSLYKYWSGIHQRLIGSNDRIKPIRQNVSLNLSGQGKTGLSLTATDEYVPSNRHNNKLPAYSKFVRALVGDTFLLAVAVLRNKEVTDPFYLRIKYNNKSFRLNNVLFETNKTELLPSSFSELNSLVTQLKEQVSMQIEIQGHTDNVGDETHNQTLSEGRARAVYNYLLSKGVDKSRIGYKGFGGKKPVVNNDTEEGRKKNRRVEMVVLKD